MKKIFFTNLIALPILAITIVSTTATNLPQGGDDFVNDKGIIENGADYNTLGETIQLWNNDKEDNNNNMYGHFYVDGYVDQYGKFWTSEELSRHENN